jgi:predicted DCC family thiol-disulfide oxidoreductase YuxK
VADATERPLVLYDGACGFCAWTLAWLLRWDTDRHLRPVAIQSEEGARVLAGMAPEERLSSVHVADRLGRLRSGGAACAAVLDELPRAQLLAALAHARPRATERAYRFLAAHRAGLGRLVPSASRDRARVLIAERMH